MDDWNEFQDEDADPVRVARLKTLNFRDMPDDAVIRVMDDYFPETLISRRDDVLVCHIEEHLYTKYWEHKFSAYAFADAMVRAVVRLAHEGHPLSDASREDEDDVHLFVRWKLRLPFGTSAEVVAESIKSAFDLVWQRADSILENSDSVLVLGKDTGPGLARLKQIASALEGLGYYSHIVKEQPDRAGESVIQKVMRFALSSKFVLIENTEAAGHLYEIPHVTKAAECVTVVLQEEGKGATWVFEDAYGKHRHWHKIDYKEGALEGAVREAAEWAERFVGEFAARQATVLPWLRDK
jgi:hypothetical protein